MLCPERHDLYTMELAPPTRGVGTYMQSNSMSQERTANCPSFSMALPNIYEGLLVALKQNHRRPFQ
jgi:hypothetical protein